MKTHRPLHRFFLIALSFLVAAAPIATVSPLAHAQSNLPDLGDVGAAELSWKVERQIGQDIMNQIRQREPSYLDDPEIESYLNKIGSRLTTAAGTRAEFHFFALEDPSINAFATFGGYVGVHSGLILNAQNESELAGVLAHEISHVTQRHLARGMEKQKQMSGVSLLLMALALLAAHSNANVSEAAIAVGSAGIMQSQLAYSREFEQEADRTGFKILEAAKFDPHAMSSFFDRLQKATRAYENNAPVYLRTHPLTVERISDMQNREQALSYRQIPDSLDFYLIRARLLARQGTPANAIARFQKMLAENRTANRTASQYGLALALERQRNWQQMEQILRQSRQEGASSPMIERLYAEALLQNDSTAEALNTYKNAMSRFPEAPALVYGYAEALLKLGKYDEGLAFLEKHLRQTETDARIYTLKAGFHAAKGENAQQHRATAEAYVLQGMLPAAIEQLELAQKYPGGFHEQSVIDARLRQLKQQRTEEIR